MESSKPHKNLRFWPEPERKPHKNQAKTTPEPDKNPVFKTHAFKEQKLGFQKLGFQLLKTRFLETATVSSSLTQLCMMAPRHVQEICEGRMSLCSFCGRIMRVKVCVVPGGSPGGLRKHPTGAQSMLHGSHCLNVSCL